MPTSVKFDRKVLIFFSCDAENSAAWDGNAINTEKNTMAANDSSFFISPFFIRFPPCPDGSPRTAVTGNGFSC